ncbi:oligosaccharide flippase family protein [Massilia sp. NR 4-1]|uniref:oligosaccharide flippase family protein n=1 Tax=Massilia sp. NR 4-1 TaxID=1678028 RepID=UPI001CBF32D1|nr:oligosaccharide flippase family protein [Massilia sp. NR 4-1]
MMGSTRQSLLISFAEKYTQLLLAIAGSVVLARLLTPEESGIYSIAAALVGLVQIVRDFGVGSYLIQERELDREKLRAALGLALAAAAAIAAVLAMASLPLAAFYSQPVLGEVLRLMALNILLLPLTATTIPCLRRQMRFGAIYTISTVQAASQLSCAVALAWLGYGCLSLAYASLLASTAGLLACLYLRPPGLPWLPSWRGTRRLLGFGACATGGNLVDELGVIAPELLIGRLLDAASVGLYGKAQGLLSLFNQAITSAVSPVVLPWYARHLREGSDVRAAYLSTVNCMTALAWPFFSFLGLMAPAAVHLLYGAQWQGAVPLIRIICLGAALYSMFSMARYLMLAMGEVAALAVLDMRAVAGRLLLLLPACLLGLNAVAWAIVAGAVWRSWLTYRQLLRLKVLAGPRLLPILGRSAVLAVLSALAPCLVLQWAAPGSKELVLLAMAGGGSALFWLIGLSLLKHELGIELLLAGQRLWGRRRNCQGR